MEGVNATPYEDNMRYFNVAIAGPVGTCYEGKKYTVYAPKKEMLCFRSFTVFEQQSTVEIRLW